MRIFVEQSALLSFSLSRPINLRDTYESNWVNFIVNGKNVMEIVIWISLIFFFFSRYIYVYSFRKNLYFIRERFSSHIEYFVKEPNIVKTLLLPASWKNIFLYGRNIYHVELYGQEESNKYRLHRDKEKRDGHSPVVCFHYTWKYVRQSVQCSPVNSSWHSCIGILNDDTRSPRL